MTAPEEFGVDVARLDELGGQLDGLADDVSALADVLAGVTADTGRSDSDEMGRLGPTDAAELLRGLDTALRGTSGGVKTCVMDYAGTDTAAQRRLERIAMARSGRLA